LARLVTFAGSANLTTSPQSTSITFQLYTFVHWKSIHCVNQIYEYLMSLSLSVADNWNISISVEVKVHFQGLFWVLLNYTAKKLQKSHSRLVYFFRVCMSKWDMSVWKTTHDFHVSKSILKMFFNKKKLVEFAVNLL
jgi:hypothetical protein